MMLKICDQCTWLRADLSGLVFAAGLTLFFPGETAASQAAEEAETHNEAIINAGLEAWANGTGSPYDLLADDAAWTIVGNSLVSRTYTSREDFLGNVIRPFGARMASRCVPTIRDIYSDDDTVIVYFDAEGMARDGKPYRNTCAWFLGLHDGKIVNATAFFDSIAFNEFWQRVTPQP